MQAQTKNARFWDMINGSWVKITLAPGQELSHYEAHGTDEGFKRTVTTYAYEVHKGVGTVYYTCESRERDCDGVCDNYNELSCDVSKLSARVCEWRINAGEEAHNTPEWEQVDYKQRDYSAEAANY